MALSCISTIYNVTNYTAPSGSSLIMAHPSNEFFSMGTNTGNGLYKWIRSSGSTTSSTGTSNTYNEPNSKATNIRFSTTYSRLVGSYVFDSSNLGGTGTMLQLFSGNTSGQSFTIASGTSTWITLRFSPGLYMQPFHFYYFMDSAQTATSGKSYMVQGSNDNGSIWTNLFTSNILLNSANNGQPYIIPSGLTTTAYNMFRWTYNVNATTTGFRNVDVIGKFYYDNSAIPNKLLHYNFEQSTPIDQFGGIVPIILNNPINPITNNRAKFGTQSLTSNAIASSSVYLRTDTALTLTNSTGVSFAFWLYLNGAVSGGDSKIFEAGNNDKYFIRIPNNTLTLWWCDRGSGVTVSSGEWMHIVCTINSSDFGEMFINGSSVTSFTDSGRWTTAVANIFIGRSTLGGHVSLNGNIDDFKAYSKVLTQTEINQIYTNTDK